MPGHDGERIPRSFCHRNREIAGAWCFSRLRRGQQCQRPARERLDAVQERSAEALALNLCAARKSAISLDEAQSCFPFGSYPAPHALDRRSLSARDGPPALPGQTESHRDRQRLARAGSRRRHGHTNCHFEREKLGAQTRPERLLRNRGFAVRSIGQGETRPTGMSAGEQAGFARGARDRRNLLDGGAGGGSGGRARPSRQIEPGRAPATLRSFLISPLCPCPETRSCTQSSDRTASGRRSPWLPCSPLPSDSRRTRPTQPCEKCRPPGWSQRSSSSR